MKSENAIRDAWLEQGGGGERPMLNSGDDEDYTQNPDNQHEALTEDEQKVLDAWHKQNH